MKNKGIDKVMSAAGVVLFVGLIQAPDAPFWALASLAVGLYEISLWACRIAHKEAKKSRKRRYITATRFDIERWADMQFNPYREVS
jgi:Sec-independent protein secretion pathway component TatC